jgi:lipoyl(octanoyl) transferase
LNRAPDTTLEARARPVIAWWDPPADGATNMALDEALAAEAARLDRVLVRLSTWSEPTLSLGAFQAIAEARAHRALAGLSIVRRPSGGGAILHGSDVTLSVAVPRLHPCGGTPQRLYDAVHEALVAELSACGVQAGLSAGGARAGGGRGEGFGSNSVEPAAGAAPTAGPPAEGPLLCFDRRAVGDVVMPIPDGRFGSDAKILGSAQRRLRGAVLQHGSLLLAANRLVPEESRHPGLEELQRRSGSGGAWAWGSSAGKGLLRGWLTRLAATLGEGLETPAGRFFPSPEAGYEEGLTRFQQDSWNARR